MLMRPASLARHQSVYASLLLSVLLGVSSAGRADDAQPAPAPAPQQNGTLLAQDNPPAKNDPNAAKEDEEMRNKRMQTLEGSKSPWSGQFQLQYVGSTLSHPFSKEAANPDGEVPPPVVTMQGTFSFRYRIDKDTTVGLGTGIATQTPFQGPKHSTMADPYVDIARSFTLGPIHNRADFQFTHWTNYQYFHDLGWREGFTLLDESFYEFSFGLTAGLALEYDWNSFAGRPNQYDEDVKMNQTVYDLMYDPYFEYALNDMFNLRTVIGIIDYHNRNEPALRYDHPQVYQTLGLGISATKSVFVYLYGKFVPYAGKQITTNDSTFGFSTIINIL